MGTRFLTTTEAGRLLGVGPDRVRQFDGELAPMRMVGGQRLYDEARVIAFGRAREARAGARAVARERARARTS